MAIPKFDDLFTAVLTGLSDGAVVHNREFRIKVADELGLPQEQRNQKMGSGSNRVENRLLWSIVYLVQAQAISRPKRGYLAITDLGRELLANSPNGVTLKDLEKTPGLQAWYQRTIELREAKKKKGLEGATTGPDAEVDAAGSPLERMQDAADALRDEVANQLLERLRSEHWEFMERAVLQVLYGMGYGSSQDELFHVGGPGDGGIDGIIGEDKLGLSRIYVQSKRYKAGSSISEETVRSFIGRMDINGITKGVFITASHFTDAALKAAEANNNKQIALIDGATLAGIMVDYGVGVTVEAEFRSYKLDENFFDEESA
jgi:restriction system protein